MPLNENFPNYLKIATVPLYVNLPATDFQINENKTIHLLENQLIKLLSRMLHYETKILIPREKEQGNALPDGNWTGVIGLLQRGEADLGISSVSILYELVPHIHFSTPYIYSSWTFITDKPQYSPNNFATLKPFSFNVWLCLAVSLLLTLAISLIFEKSRITQNLLLNIYGSLFQKKVPFHTVQLSTKVLIFLWVIAAFFISESYKAVLLSSLTFPIQTGVRNIEDLALASESDSFKCATYTGSANQTIKSIQYSGNVKMKKIADCLNRNRIFDNDIAGFLHPRTYRKAFIGLNVYFDPFTPDYFISKDSFFTSMISIAAEKSFCCKETLDRAVLKIYAMGLAEKFIKDVAFFYHLLYCKKNIEDIDLEEVSSMRRLSLHHFCGAFVCLITGHFLSSVVLVVEIFYYGKSKENIDVNVA